MAESAHRDAVLVGDDRPTQNMTLLRKVAQTGAEALQNINADYYNQMADALNSIPTGSAEHAGLINCAARLIRSHATKKEHTVRQLDDHKVNPANDTLLVEVLDEPGQGGACHVYSVTTPPPVGEQTIIKFQNGPISANGVNGLTHEVLLAIVADRLRSFQKGPYSCKANACALTHIEEAQHWLQQRTIERMRRGVEGTHTV